MADVPPLLPPLSPVSAAPTAVGQQQNPPPLPQLPVGALLQGTVSEQGQGGNVVIKTDELRLVISTSYPLQKGAQVAVRLDQGLTAQIDKNAPPQVRIVSVEGKTPEPVPTAQSALPAATAAQQRELAKPIGLLLDITNRTDIAAGKTPADAAAQQLATKQPIRGVAAEVVLSDGSKATAVLLRPAVSQRAEATLLQLAQATGSADKAAAHLPPPLANALRPGLQLQVQVVQMPSITPTSTLVSIPPSPATVPQAPAATMADATTHTVTSSITQGQPSVTTESPIAPTAAQMRSGYASYARQTPAMMSTPPAGATPPHLAAQSPRNSVQSAPLPTQSQAPQVQTASTENSTLQSLQAPTSTQQTSVVSSVSQSVSPATPVQVAHNITPQVVDQLLTKTEAQPLPQGQMAAVVMGKEPTGALIVQTRLGMFTLPQVQADAMHQPGSVITWQVRTILPPQATAQPLPMTGAVGGLAAASQLTSEWSALHELTAALQTMQGAAAAQAIQRIVPHIGSNMGAGLLFFMNILRKGDVTEWLGKDIIDKLEHMGKADVVQRLGNDLAAVRGLFADQPQGNWQAMFFPVMVEKELHQAQMFMKQEQDDKKKGGSGTRFIVELDLSNLGPMQIDGFIKKREHATQFDLVMRTMAELPDELKSDIYAIFDNAQQVANFSGSLHFRLVSEFTTSPLEEMQEAAKQGHSSIIA
jgi:predicted RecA/RadA family phage recombinase